MEEIRPKAIGNVLVIGNSGVGKSTLINAVLGKDTAQVGWGPEGTTKELKVYGDERAPFRVIDTVGFEPSWFKRRQAINSVKKWSKNRAKEGDPNSAVNVIWFCVDGTSRKLFPEAINSLTEATRMWKSVPVIVVITKSYSMPERAQNIEMVKEAFAKQKHSVVPREIIPVVADPYVIQEDSIVEQSGIMELIELTNSLMPEGVEAAADAIKEFQLNRKRVFAHSIVTLATAGGAAVGAAPIPFPDGLILEPTEVGMLNAIARIYGIRDSEKSQKFKKSLIDVGTVSVAAKMFIQALKAIPGIQLGAGVINSIIAGGIVAALGEASVYLFEQIYLGKKTLDDIDWARNFVESKLSAQIIEKIGKIIEEFAKDPEKKLDIPMLLDLLKDLFMEKPKGTARK